MGELVLQPSHCPPYSKVGRQTTKNQLNVSKVTLSSDKNFVLFLIFVRLLLALCSNVLKLQIYLYPLK